MKRMVLAFALLSVAVSLLSGGCPQDPTRDSGTIHAPGSHSAGTGELGPTLDTEGDDGQTGVVGNVNTGTANVGGDTTQLISVPDALTAQFPGCEDPIQGAFWRAEILRLVNQERMSRGAGALTANPTLDAQASQYACELIYYDFFDHVNPVTHSDLAARADEFGYDYWIIGENLAAGQRSPVEAVTDWMNSPCHRENMLNPAFTELGVGVRIGGRYGYYWVLEFGRPFSEERYAGPLYADPECRR